MIFTAGGFWSFLAFGFIDNLKGPLLPEIVRGGLDYAQAGTLVLASYIGFVTATLTTGILADRTSNRTVLWLAGLCLVSGGAGVMLYDSYAWLIACLAVVGYGLGAIELGANALMIELHSAAPGRFLNLLSVFHGCGSLIVPIVAAALIAMTWRWQTIYALTALFSVPLLVLFWPRSVASPQPNQAAAIPSTTEKPVSVWRAGFTPTMFAYYLMISTYVAMELSVGTWMMEHLQVTYQLSTDSSSHYLSAFFALLMIGRLGGAAFVDRCNYHLVIGLCLALSGLCLLGGLYGSAWIAHPAWLYLLPLSGLCMSVVFPTITAAVSRLHNGQAGAVMGLLFASGGVGGTLGPWLVGLAAKQTGLTHGLALTLVMDVVALVALWVTLWTAKAKPSIQ